MGVSLAWCQAVRCSQRVRQGKLLCDRHWGMLPGELRSRAGGVDPRGILFASLDAHEVLLRLETLAEAIESVAAAEGYPGVNAYRLRATKFREVLSRASVAVAGPERRVAP